jgi:hypothetical protein
VYLKDENKKSLNRSSIELRRSSVSSVFRQTCLRAEKSISDSSDSSFAMLEVVTRFEYFFRKSSRPC